MKNLFSFFVTIAAYFLPVLTEDQADWVDVFNLPFEFQAKPFYAGYLTVSATKKYYYVYHPSESNPSKDPLMVRISAGPGCSSLYSWLYSKGPFIFTPMTDTFRQNPYNWNKQANVLFIQGPAGVGFSKNSSPDNKTQHMDDETFAFENIKALFSFYDKFPELKDQQLYISGQQYAGITVPLLAQMIIRHNNDPETPAWTRINLKGMLVQNPCTLDDQCDEHFQFTSYTIQYLMHHYYITKQKYEQYRTKCILRSQSCQQLLHEIEQSFVDTDSDINNIYKQCVKQIAPEQYKCVDMVGIINFLNHADIQQDLHVEEQTHWQMCNLDLMQNFNRSANGSVWVYEKLLREQHGLRVWIVSGSLSASIPMVGTRKWLEQIKHDMGLPTLRRWESWKYNDDINAGEVQEIRGITFASVRSAGASIYLDQPEIGYHILDSFLKGKSL